MTNIYLKFAYLYPFLAHELPPSFFPILATIIKFMVRLRMLHSQVVFWYLIDQVFVNFHAVAEREEEEEIKETHSSSA